MQWISLKPNAQMSCTTTTALNVVKIKVCRTLKIAEKEKARKLRPNKGYAGTIRIKTNCGPIMALDRI